jgi:hypothetical protein
MSVALRNPRARLLVALAAVAIIASSLWIACRDVAARSQHPVLVFTTLPLLWHESAGINDLLRDDMAPHWSLRILRTMGEVRGIDSLAGPDGRPAIAQTSALLVMAQPRPLSPVENVALDQWVRAGGHVLLFADPMLTGHSRFAPGDARRPQDVALLSPILRRWGLELTVDESQPEGERLTSMLGGAVPVNLPGRFRLAGQSPECQLRDGGLVALCRIGRGRAVAVADAALLEESEGSGRDARVQALEALLRVSDE